MKTSSYKLGGVVVLLATLGAAASLAQPGQGIRGSGMRVTPSPAASRVGVAPPRAATFVGPNVPNVVGMAWFDADRTMRTAGYLMRTRSLDEPQPSVPPGQIVAASPAAGTPLAAGGVVEVRIARTATTVRLGELSVDDWARRNGFDLDEGRYEEITHGADLVLRDYKDTRHPDPNGGSTVYSGHGVFAEPSDGAVFAELDSTDEANGVGSYFVYIRCQANLASNKVLNRVEVSNNGGAFCVRTSDGKLAAVEFRQADNPTVGTTDFKFRVALFPDPLLATPRAPRAPFR